MGRIHGSEISGQPVNRRVKRMLSTRKTVEYFLHSALILPTSFATPGGEQLRYDRRAEERFAIGIFGEIAASSGPQPAPH